MARFRYQHIKSSVEGKAPTAAQLKVAEIGVNDFAGDEKLFIKNSENEVVDFPRGYSRTYIDENERVTAEALNDLNERKLDASAYTPTDLSNYYTKDETSGATEISTALADKSDTGHTHDDRYYTKSEIDEFEETTAAALNDLEYDKQDKLSAGTGIDITNNVISVTGGSTDVEEELEVIAASLNDLEDRKLDKTDVPDLGDLEEVIAAALNDLEERKANEADVEEIGETVAYSLNDLECRKADKDEFDEQFETIAASLNDLEDRKLDKTDIPDLGDLEEVIAASLNDLEDRKLDKTDLPDYDEQFETIAASLNDLEDRKLDASAYTPTDLSNYYTKDEIDGDDRVIAESLNDLNTRKANKIEDLDGIKLKKITQAAYDALVQAGTTDPNTLYIITD